MDYNTINTTKHLIKTENPQPHMQTFDKIKLNKIFAKTGRKQSADRQTKQMDYNTTKHLIKTENPQAHIQTFDKIKLNKMVI